LYVKHFHVGWQARSSNSIDLIKLLMVHPKMKGMLCEAATTYVGALEEMESGVAMVMDPSAGQ